MSHAPSLHLILWNPHVANSPDKLYIPKEPKAAEHEHVLSPPLLPQRPHPQKTWPPLPEKKSFPYQSISPSRTSGSTTSPHRYFCALGLESWANPPATHTPLVLPGGGSTTWCDLRRRLLIWSEVRKGGAVGEVLAWHAVRGRDGRWFGLGHGRWWGLCVGCVGGLSQARTWLSNNDGGD